MANSNKRDAGKVPSYTETVMDHFMNPRNMGHLDHPDATGEVGNPVCGDLMSLYIKVDKNKKGEDTIKNICFETLGCGAAIATSSIITEMAIGKTVAEAWRISNQDVASELGGLPPAKMHCSNLAASALKQAIEKYYAKKKTKPKFLA
jgi:nitrogen fixation protein NifU and related proteins